jgi:hypothetical protein
VNKKRIVIAVGVPLIVIFFALWIPAIVKYVQMIK